MDAAFETGEVMSMSTPRHGQAGLSSLCLAVRAGIEQGTRLVLKML